MASVTVDVDLSEFDLDEIVSELIERLESKYKSRKDKVSEKNSTELKGVVKELFELLFQTPSTDTIKIISLDDQLKYNHLAKVFEKYTCAEVEILLP